MEKDGEYGQQLRCRKRFERAPLLKLKQPHTHLNAQTNTHNYITALHPSTTPATRHTPHECTTTHRLNGQRHTHNAHTTHRHPPHSPLSPTSTSLACSLTLPSPPSSAQPPNYPTAPQCTPLAPQFSSSSTPTSPPHLTPHHHRHSPTQDTVAEHQHPNILCRRHLPSTPRPPALLPNRVT